MPILRFLVLGLLLSITIFAAEKKPVGTGGSFKGPLGLQMYSLRHISAKNPLQALDMARDFGFVELETGPYRFKPDEFLKHLSDRGLKLVSTGSSYDGLRTNAAGVAASAKALGAKYVMCAWIPHARGQFNEKNARDAAEVFNRAGEILKKEGITFAYHIHGFEFHPWQNGTLFDLIAQETKPEFVSFELDVYWAVYGGADPVALLEKYGSRWVLMHVKDLKKGVKGNLIGTGPDEESVAIGQGQVNWPAVLKAAEKAGVKHYFIEDESLDAATQIPQSIKSAGDRSPKQARASITHPMRARIHFAFLALAAIFLAAGCQGPRRPSVHYISAEQRVREASAAWDRAFNAGVADQLASLYAPHAISMPPALPTLNGQPAILEDFRGFFAANSARHQTYIEEIIIEDDLSIERSRYRMSFRPRAGGPETIETGRHIEIRRRINGQWLITHEIWNTDPPAPR